MIGLGHAPAIPAGLRPASWFQVKYGVIWVLALMMVFFALTSEVFRTPDNLLEILRQSAISAIVVLGLTWIVASGEFDVAFADIVALTSVITAWLLRDGYPLAVAVAAALAAGTLLGLLSGALVGYLRYQPLITTIAISGMAKALAAILGKAAPIYITTPTVVHQIVFGTVLGIPLLFITALAIYVFAGYLQDRTTTGQHLYALGENRVATQEAGIRGPRIIFSFYVLSGVLTAVAGVLLTGQVASGQPFIGGSFFLDGLTAVFLGSLVVRVGQPNVVGTLVAVVLLQVLGNGLTHLGLPHYIGSITKGALLILGVVIVTVSRYRHGVATRLQGG